MTGTLNELATQGGAEHIPSVSLNYQVDFSAELWSADLSTLVADISADLVVDGSVVSYDGSASPRHTASLRWGEDYSYRHSRPDDPNWGQHRLKLLCSLTNLKDGEVRTYSLGYYFVETSSQVVRTVYDPTTTACYDLTTQLDTPIGHTWYAAGGTQVDDAIRDLLEAQGQWGRYAPAGAADPVTMGFRLSPTEAVLAGGRVWPLGEANTWRRVLNRLAEEGGYRMPWVDRDGVLVVDGQFGTAATVVLPISDWTVVREGARVTTNVHGAPNQWVGVGVVADSETTVIVTAQDVPAEVGAHSFEARGNRIVRKVYQLDQAEEDDTLSADAPAFQRHLTRLVSADREHTTTLDLRMAPMPVFWHSDIVEFWDAVGGGNWRVTKWSMPLDASDMSVTAVRIAE